MILWSLKLMVIFPRWSSPCGQDTVSRSCLTHCFNHHINPHPQDSWGSELHKDLKVLNNLSFLHNLYKIPFLQVHPKAQMVYKGSNPDVDSYSAFFDNMKLSKTCLDDIIRKYYIRKEIFHYNCLQEGGCDRPVHLWNRH